MFNDKREYLLKRALDIEFQEDITGDFKRDFFQLVNDVIVSMQDLEDSFFGRFMLKIERDIRCDITWPLATIPKTDGFLMYFNPILFLQNTKKEMVALLKHEIYHMMYSHYERVNILKDSYNNETISLAIDISVNQFIKNMPIEAKVISTLSNELNITLKANRTIEEYAKIIQKAFNSRYSSKIEETNNKVVKKINNDRAHKIWEEIDINESTIEGNLKKIATGIDDKNTPDDLKQIIMSFKEREELSWQELLKRMLPSIRASYKKTITRLDRRQPERMDLRGRLPKYIPEIVVAIDISASMTDEDINKIMIEVLAITKNKNGKITVIECDSEIKRIYPLRSPKDIKKRVANNGSTAFSPVFEFLREKNLRDNILIYFTDGVGEETLTCKVVTRETLWVLMGDNELSLKETFGKIRRIKSSIRVGEGKSSALDMIREVIHEWAR
jgi:predicted metal-dependent peptidase